MIKCCIECENNASTLCSVSLYWPSSYEYIQRVNWIEILFSLLLSHDHFIQFTNWFYGKCKYQIKHIKYTIEQAMLVFTMFSKREIVVKDVYAIEIVLIFV